jgi:branched-subunit amino acid transport protein
VTPWLVVFAVAGGTYLFRASMIVVSARATVPPTMERAARAAPTVSFAAIAAAGLGGQLSPAPSALAPLAGVLAAIVAVRRTGSRHAALVAGLPAVWLVSALVGAS